MLFCTVKSRFYSTLAAYCWLELNYLYALLADFSNQVLHLSPPPEMGLVTEKSLLVLLLGFDLKADCKVDEPGYVSSII